MNYDKDERSIKDLLLNMIKVVDNIATLEDCRVCLTNFFLFAEEYPVYTTTYKLPKTLGDLYEKEIALSEGDIIKLSCETLAQSKCKNWFLARRKRVSASKNAHHIKCRNKKSIESLLSEMLYEKKINTKSTQYGVSNESNARNKYRQV